MRQTEKMRFTWSGTRIKHDFPDIKYRRFELSFAGIIKY